MVGQAPVLTVDVRTAVAGTVVIIVVCPRIFVNLMLPNLRSLPPPGAPSLVTYLRSLVGD
jgi:hypothetical protein